MKLLGAGTVKWVGFTKLDFVRKIGLDNCVDSVCKLGVAGCCVRLADGLGLGGRHGCRKGLGCRESGLKRISSGPWWNRPRKRRVEGGSSNILLRVAPVLPS